MVYVTFIILCLVVIWGCLEAHALCRSVCLLVTKLCKDLIRITHAFKNLYYIIALIHEYRIPLR